MTRNPARGLERTGADSPSQGALLSALHITKRFGGVVALDDVSVEFEPGQITGIIGPNGSGKTTLFNVLTGFLRPDHGEIHWLGNEITATAAHRRARLGLARTFQDAMQMNGLTVEENVALARTAARLTGRESPSRDEILSYIGLAKSRLHIAEDLSWGESRLLGIGMPLALAPQMLLLDEPFAGLSPAVAGEVSTLLTKLRDDGYTLCVVDHKVAHLLPVCDRLIVLVNGAIIADDLPDKVVAQESVRVAYLGL